MRKLAFMFAGFVVALIGCGGNAERGAQSVAEPRYLSPKITSHRLEEHLGANIILQEMALPPTLVLEVHNGGASGDVLIQVEQESKRWESRVHLNEGEKRTVRMDLPGARRGFISMTAEAAELHSTLTADK
jgi:hypothetical protein